MSLPTLFDLECRVLGVLVEKQRTVPDTYPLSLNAIVSGCNQKTSRDPIMTVSDADAQAAIDALKGRSLVVEPDSAAAVPVRSINLTSAPGSKP